MPRYIDADEILKDKVSNAYISRFEIELAPTADVREVKHGKWIDASNKSKAGKKCSVCGARIKYSEYFNGNHLYCHKCGVRMDGGDCR